MNKKFFYLSIPYLNSLYICLATLALIFGGIIYMLFRASEPIFLSWTYTFGLGHWQNIARHHFLSLGPHLPKWFVYSLPNGLWAFGYALLITNIWSGSTSRTRYLWMATIPILVLGYELLQYPGIIPGTFCKQDIFLGVAGLIIGITLQPILTKFKKYEKAN